MHPPLRATLFASLLAVVCAGVLWAAYDWFQGRYLRAFSEHTAKIGRASCRERV